MCIRMTYFSGLRTTSQKLPLKDKEFGLFICRIHEEIIMSKNLNQKPDSKSAILNLPDGQSIELPVLVGTENEHAIDISKLRPSTGYITMDSGFGNSGSCQSKITFLDGEKGILRYRGIPIEQLAAKALLVFPAFFSSPNSPDVCIYGLRRSIK